MGVFHIPQISRTGALQSYVAKCHSQDTCFFLVVVGFSAAGNKAPLTGLLKSIEKTV